MKKRLMVFGAGGFVGSSFVDSIDDARYDLIKVVHRKKDQIGEVEVDLCNKAQICSVISDNQPDLVVNLAGVNSIVDAQRDYCNAIYTNVIGSINILDAVAKYSSHCKVLLVGSSEVYGRKEGLLVETDELKPRNLYGLTKLWQEQVAGVYSNNGVHVICTRSFNHTGVRQRDSAVVPSFCRQAAEIALGLKDPVIYTGNIDIERDFLDVRDVVDVYMRLLESDISDGVFNVCSGKRIRIRDILNNIIAFTGKDIEICIDKSRVREDDRPMIVGDIEKLRSALLWEPRHSIEETLYDVYCSRMALLNESKC